MDEFGDFFLFSLRELVVLFSRLEKIVDVLLAIGLFFFSNNTLFTCDAKYYRKRTTSPGLIDDELVSRIERSRITGLYSTSSGLRLGGEHLEPLLYTAEKCPQTATIIFLFMFLKNSYDFGGPVWVRSTRK